MSEEDRNPMRAAQRLARSALPKRFYQKAAAAPYEAGYAVFLDGRVAKTPARRPIAVGEARLAKALAAEWDAQQSEINPGAMPLTRIVNAAIDRVAGERDAVGAEIVKYAGSDLVCYRADGPATLTTAQEKAWAPILAWARQRLSARFVLAEGVVHVAQSPAALAAVERALAPLDPLRLAAISTVTTLTGSALIALALADAALSVAAAWEAAHVDEDWQMSQWGVDAMAMERRAARFAEMRAAALILGTP
jgi:chaperone required for assembly of F1-ATPase